MRNIFSTAQAGGYLGVSAARVRKLIAEGRLAAEKQGRDYVILPADVEEFAKHGRKGVGRPKQHSLRDAPPAKSIVSRRHAPRPEKKDLLGGGLLYRGDALAVLPGLAGDIAQVIIADPPYFQVLEEAWDNSWKTEQEYLDFSVRWVRACKRILRSDGLLYIFGQLGKREHIWLHSCSLLAKEMQFHDMIIWDRAVGYNERSDSFTPQYEMILVLRKTARAKPYFNKDAVRVLYEEEKIKTYLRDKRYKNKQAREQHLRKGKYATNILRIPSLKGSSREKAGHPSQKPITLINDLIRSSSRKGDLVVDPFLGSGTTAEAAENHQRRWIGIEQNPAYIAMTKKRLSRIKS